MKADGLGANGAADAVAMSTPLVPIERASPENAIHVSLMIETLLFAVRDEPIASGVASHLRVREFGVPKPGANMALTPCFLLIPNKAIRTRCNAIQAVSDELARESLAVVLNQKAFKADMKTAWGDPLS